MPSALWTAIAIACAFGLFAALAVLFTGMRGVMDLGGFVARGGPYEIAHPAPDWVWLLPLSIMAGFLFGGVHIVAASRNRGFVLYGVVWVALFGSLGFNFLEYGFNPPVEMGVERAWGWIVSGVVFILMTMPVIAGGVRRVMPGTRDLYAELWRREKARIADSAREHDCRLERHTFEEPTQRRSTMRIRLLAILLTLSLAFVLGACSPADDPDVGAPESPVDDGAAGLRLAPGLYDLEDGSVQAIGTLEWVDLEGGFWAVTDGTAAGDEGGNVAVIANGDALQSTLEPLEGQQVSIIGERFDGASIRMAGPEIVAETVEAMSDTPGAAE